ncbi:MULTISPECIES: hypothetical protein [unclassified Actinomyces]|uniref:hypothetical protein n=1 Tax=unclassified Actinomyces TaxID=2609248 RepID=UPI00192A66BB|nr:MULTISPECIES: hypothetical protein [unclassified Actinomyces]
MSGVGGRVRDWFNGGDPDGRAKLRAWARGHDGRSEGYTYGMMGPAIGLSVLAALLYGPTQGYGSIVALVLAIFLLLGRQMIERQVARDASDLREAERQYGRTRNPEYLEFTRLRAGGLLEDNKMLTADTRAWLTRRIEWAQAEQDKRAKRDRRKGRGRRSSGGE